MEYVTLNNGIKMPILGFGVFQFNDKVECEQAVLDAISSGYRLIDTASSYQNEEAVGLAIQKCGVPREELFITTKLSVSDSGYENTINAFEKSLERLKLEYIDLYLIHQPFGDYYGSWRAMEELYKKGIVRAVGVSNFMPDRLVDLIINNEIIPAINQVEVNPFYQRNFDYLVMKEKEVQMQSWGPFAEGRNGLYKNAILIEIGEKYKKSVAQVVLRWLIQREIACIPKAIHKERIKENFDVLNFSLSDEDMKEITKLETNISSFFYNQDYKMLDIFCDMENSLRIK